ncbi:phosphatidylserine/phosphatidylglycerophosphate/cardiolipin synthase family protein [Sphingosinicella sp. CPCC 101087]|uniref:phospholipase D-like domain-containing protein n=1 Tax=Sphingosinicella sp. CPCC 101087 TaxID=2497754 RepID=UPI00101C5281|nr:phosphatidylserine/phosphatidylglycerophosphate/cardiolipin synthase family protein [Sphingosinicella sp. CPCC 101087]
MHATTPPTVEEPITVAGNRLTLLADGPDRLEALIALIEGAKESLRVLYYIWEDDDTGRRVRDALVAALGRGVCVSLLVDGFGAANATEAFFQPLIDAKCRFCRFAPRFGRRYLLRNHQKLALADERRVIIGGFNIADEYFGTIESGAWRDLGLLVEGESVSCLAPYFDDLFSWASKPDPRIRQLRRILSRRSHTDGALHWLFGGPTRRLSPWARAVRRDLRAARRLDLVAAYFAPGPALLRRSGNVARRRGEVRLITAAKSDNGATVSAARHTYWLLLKRGVRIFEYQPTKMHTKLFVLDDVVHIGSANFDMRSLYLNLEMMLRIEDPGFAGAMRRFVDGEVAQSVEITLDTHSRQRTLFNRLRWGFAYFLLAIADYRISHRLNFRNEPLAG